MGRLNGSGWTAVICGITAVVTGGYLRSTAVVGVGASLVLAAVIALISSRRAYSIEIVRTVRPARPRAGSGAVVGLRITNIGLRPSRRLRLDEPTGAGSTTVEVPPLDPAQVWSGEYQVEYARRGSYQLGPARSRRSDPLGLTSGGGAIPGTHDVIVHPTTHRLLTIRAGRVRDLDGPTSNDSSEGGIAFHTLREYAPGDDLRLVHWRSTARHGRMMVRKNVDVTRPGVALIVDVRRHAYSHDTQFEAALEVAASFITTCAISNAPVSLALTQRDETQVHIGRQDEREWELLDMLSTATLVDDALAPSQITTLHTGASAQRTLVVVSGSVDDAERGAITDAATGFSRIVLAALTTNKITGGTNNERLHTIEVPSAADFARQWNSSIITG